MLRKRARPLYRLSRRADVSRERNAESSDKPRMRRIVHSNVRNTKSESDARRFRRGERDRCIRTPALNQLGQLHHSTPASQEFTVARSASMFSDNTES